MKIAILGSGIAGLSAAYHLHRGHDVTVFEAGSHVGGHTNTIEVRDGDCRVPIDTGFIVFNERTYPHFLGMLRATGVDWKPSSMGFSVQCEASGLEYSGAGWRGLFAQRRNLLRPRHWWMIREILRFYREARAALQADRLDGTIGDFLEEGRYSNAFIEHHLLPMAGSVWSTEDGAVREIPARFLLQFFDNHGFLQVDERPRWLVVEGGSREYVRKMTAGFATRIHCNTPVHAVARWDDRAVVATQDGQLHRFDHVVLACHSDEALAVLSDPSPAEREILGAIRYQPNEAVLHSDASLMPRRRATWSSWNHHVPAERGDRVSCTYWMNELQGLDCPTDWFVTLNRTAAIRPEKIERTIQYRHPAFDLASVRAQERRREISGVRRTWYCGAYWRYGFHEDGFVSGMDVAHELEELQREATRVATDPSRCSLLGGAA